MTEQTPEKKSKRKLISHESLALALSFAALLVSIAAGLFSYWQLHEARRHNRLSLRPEIQFHMIRKPYEPYPQVGLHMANQGTGLAYIDRFDIYVDGELVSTQEPGDFSKVIEEIASLKDSEFPIIHTREVSGPFPPGDPLLLLGIDDKTFTPERGAILEEAISHIGVYVSYQSLYEDRYEKGYNLR
jgi:hypothetical protein